MSKNTWVISVVVLIVVLAAVAYFVFRSPEAGMPPVEGNQPATIQGTVTQIAASARVLTVQADGISYAVAADSGTRVYDEGGREASFAYIRRGFDITAEGVWSTGNALRAAVIRVTRAPAIIIYSPANESVVSSPTITVSGIARVFENTFSIRVRTSTTTKILEEPVMTDAKDAGQFGEFNYSFTLSTNVLPSDNKIYIDALEYSARDGSETNKVTIAIEVTHQQTTTVKVYFNNDRLDPQVSCTKVFEIQRVIPYTQSVGQAAINELLTGPIDKEPGLGYYSNIPSAARLRSLRIENGTAYADFNAELDRNVGGSCRVSAIRAQITQTLRQFPTVQNVVISVNGNSTEALQP
jgi:heme/copper-type cytochrome/quinol oxidase subunit 2